MILDTCALFWLSGADFNKISESTLKKIDAAMHVYISAITGFEVGIKSKSGKLQLPAEPQIWLDTVLKFHRIEVIPLSLAICVQATELPSIHKDPCDRFIIATALNHNMPVVTADKHFTSYGVEVMI